MFGYVLIGMIIGLVCFLVSYLFVWPLLPSLLLFSAVVSSVTVLVPACLSFRRPNTGFAGGVDLHEPSQNGTADA